MWSLPLLTAVIVGWAFHTMTAPDNVDTFEFVATSAAPNPAHAPAPSALPRQDTSDTSSSVLTIDSAWLATTSSATAIPPRALTAYALADLTLSREQPNCGIGWNTISAIGQIESSHATHGNTILGDDGWTTPRILGPSLNGDGFAAIEDTEDGIFDGDPIWDRAVGPMQFIPSTWATWGADGNNDGIADPNQIDDAALATARYLCHAGPMVAAEQWRTAVFSYNHLDSYVNDVATTAAHYAQQAGQG